MAAGYIFIASCIALMGLALTLLTREVFAERARNRAQLAQESLLPTMGVSKYTYRERAALRLR